MAKMGQCTGASDRRQRRKAEAWPPRFGGNLHMDFA